ncbi:GNAT family N-acetyltransferase [Dorea formicigenerans]|uniref:GNAT family N-acetyltransferase n=1 Tax=Dorea formicigenerans TaxID=39486 RepID=A0A412MEN0_9FIRM|nr:GNAT family N-acetyltransferase [Dorea formicigenerans]RGT08957.1 GNAT family N-acetyltransferase [Dorea formicigenerans]RHE26785.1 GNAT family N-acetyltransferase [Dorea formicigenerans]
MVTIREVKSDEKKIIDEIVTIHLNTFTGFFLTFMGRGFLRQMYQSYCDHEESGLLVAEGDGKTVGFLAYSSDFSGLYKFMIKTRLVQFAWYSIGAFFRRPSAFLRIIKAFLKPSEVIRKEKYVELSSIGVAPNIKSKGIGSLLIGKLKKQVDFEKYAYITLETDAINNEDVIHFYEKNGFIRERMFETGEGRKMYEYRFVGEK